MEVKSSKPVFLSLVKETLEKRAGEGELGYEQSQALEHAVKFCAADSKKSDSLKEKLTKNSKITDELASKLINVSPKTAATVKAILSKDKIDMSDDELADIVKELS